MGCWRKRWGAGILVLAVAVPLFGPAMRDAGVSALLLLQLARPMEPGLFTRLTSAPQVSGLAYPGAKRTIEANWYLPRGAGTRAAIILVHGVNEEGKDDARIVWLADLLARSGFAVLTPDFLGFKSLKLRTSDIEEMVASVQYLAGRPDVRGDRIGIIGFSYGAGPVLIAAADPRIRDRLRFVVSFGGYYDTVNLVTFVTTGFYEFDGERTQRIPNDYVRWIFLKYNLDLLHEPRDRSILAEIAAEKAKNPAVDAGPLARRLSPAGRGVYLLLMNRDPALVPDLIAGLDPAVRAQIADLSPSRVMQQLRARLIIVHGKPDDYIPHTESLRLIRAAPDKAKVRAGILSIFSHVRPSFPGFTLWNFIRVYIPEGGRLWYLVYDLVREQR